MATERQVVAEPATGGRPPVADKLRLRFLGRPRQLVLPALVVAYVAARTSIAARVEPFRTFDSRSYAGMLDRPDPTATLSFTGHAPRLWGTPLLYSLVGTDSARALLQALIGTVAWVVLVVALWITLRALPVRLLAAVALFGLALTPPAYLWDHTLISESLSINLGLVTFGLLAIWVRTRSVVAAVAMPVTALWWMFTRQDVLLFVGLVLLVLAGLAWRSRPHRRAAVAGLVVLAAGLAWNAAILGPTDRAFAKWSASGYSQTEETFLYRLMRGVMVDRRMRTTYYEELGMPVCPPLERVTAQTSWNVRRVGHAYRACPELRAWAAEHKMSSGYRYALADPRHYASTMDKVLPVALGSRQLDTYARPAPMLPAGVQAVYFPAERLALPLLAAVGLLALLAGSAAGAWRRRRRLMVAGVLGVAVSLASVLASLMLSAGEFGRFGIQESLYLRISLLLLLLGALDAALDRVAERRVGHPAGTGPAGRAAVDIDAE